MMLNDLIKKCRSYRRFDESYKVPEGQLVEILDNVRLIGSSKNAQPLRYMIITSPDYVNQLTALSAWAGYLKDWPGPTEGERPTAYIFIVGENEPSSVFQQIDLGMALQTMMLELSERELGGCIIGSFNKKEAMNLLGIDEKWTPLNLIALGKPVEEVKLEDMKNNDCHYWRDENNVHHVPKRTLNEILIGKK